ncbi:MAG: transposase [Bacteroidota bacterium]|jgi:putative transposase
MQLAPNALYHIYIRGNNRQPIFFHDRNYDFFINKAYTELKSEIDFLAYCLMPNHFHLSVYTKPTCNAKEFSNGMRTLLSSYTRAIQKQEQITGSLFQQNTKCKELISMNIHWHVSRSTIQKIRVLQFVSRKEANSNTDRERIVLQRVLSG